MNKQQKWDALLMRGWQNEKSMGWVLWEFYTRHGITDLQEQLDDLRLLNLKRTFTKRSKNHYEFNLGFPVRAFVHRYCIELSNKLWDGESPLLYILSLDDFKWVTDKDLTIKRAARLNKQSRNRRRTRHIPLAGGSLHDNRKGWNVVK